MTWPVSLAPNPGAEAISGSPADARNDAGVTGKAHEVGATYAIERRDLERAELGHRRPPALAGSTSARATRSPARRESSDRGGSFDQITAGVTSASKLGEQARCSKLGVGAGMVA